MARLLFNFTRSSFNFIYFNYHQHPESENLYCEKIDIGTEIREIASGLQKFIKIEDMTGLVAVMVNLKPRPLAG